MLAGSIWFFSDLFAEKVDAPRMKAKTSDEEDNLKDLLAEETRKITFKTTMPANAR
jgi:hypothetical protein